MQRQIGPILTNLIVLKFGIAAGLRRMFILGLAAAGSPRAPQVARAGCWKDSMTSFSRWREATSFIDCHLRPPPGSAAHEFARAPSRRAPSVRRRGPILARYNQENPDSSRTSGQHWDAMLEFNQVQKSPQQVSHSIRAQWTNTCLRRLRTHVRWRRRGKKLTKAIGSHNLHPHPRNNDDYGEMNLY